MAMSRTLCVLLCASQAYGHGHVLDPPSRAELCSNIHTPASEKNTNCGQIMWEPFSIEGPDGWPADGTIPAGGAHSRFPELNEQTATRWGKVPMSGGATKFTWTFNANHVTKDYTYYMTRAGWNPNAPLTRATFEDAPFCVVDGGMKQPPMTTDHTCNVPTLEGYHIILSVWDVGDTSNSFFNVIDVMFSGGACPSDTSGCGCDWTDNGAKCNTDDGSECYCKCCCQHTGQCAWQSGGAGGGGGGGGSGSTCALPSGLDADVAAVDNTGFATCHGKLRLSGLQLVGAQGEAVQLMGMSSHGLHWFANCYTKESITHLVTRWGINVFRAAMYIGEGGYGTNPALKQTVLDIVQWCKELGIYVIVNWHTLSPGNPNDAEYAGADAFWQDMARTLKDETHVLYEIANEPNGVSWGQVLSYHNRILALIRAEDAETVVLAGTPTWSQDIHEAAARPVDLPHNVMYVFHFYAGSHTHLQSRVQEVASQIPLFVSEWGTSEASGDGGPFLDNAQAFLEGFKSAGSQGVQLSWTSWSLADKAEVSAALQAGACASGDWDSVSCTGSYVRTYIRTNAVPCAGPAPVPVPPVPVPTPPTPPCNPINTEEAVVRDLWRPTAVNSLPAYAVSENTLGWTLGDDQVTLHNFPPVLLKDGVRAFYPDQTSEIPLGAEIQVECPANCDDTPCEVIVVTYHCVPCSSATNGKFPATMPLAGWAPGHCSPRFSFLADRHRMVGFRKLVGACETEVLPATEVALSNIAVFVRQGAHDCGLFVQEEMCEDSNECAWKDGACSSTWCPAAIPTGPPTCAPCAQTEIDLD